MAGTVSQIVIEELGGANRRLTLFGAGLPKQGANWPGAQRVVTTWYAGNARQATQHVLGPVERQSQWNGEWNTTRLVRSPAQFSDATGVQVIAQADDLRAVVEDMLRAGTLLRVTWISDPGRSLLAAAGDTRSDGGLREQPLPPEERKIVREGRATEWDFQYARIDDITWSITFDWSSRGATSQKSVSTDDFPNAGQLVTLAAAALAVSNAVDRSKLVTSNRTLPKSATRFTLGQLEALVDTPTRLMRDISQAANSLVFTAKALGDVINKGRATPFNVANQAVDVANGAVAVSNNFIDSMSRQPPESMALQSNLATVTRNASYYGDGVKQSQYMATAAQRTRSAFRAQAQGRVTATGEAGKGVPPANRTQGAVGEQNRPLAVYLTVEGDTLIGVSIKFYGTEAGAYSIAFSNAMRPTLAVLPAGRVLVIPQLNAGRAGGLQPWPSGRPGTAPSARAPTEPGGLTPTQGGGPAILPPGTFGP